MLINKEFWKSVKSVWIKSLDEEKLKLIQDGTDELIRRQQEIEVNIDSPVAYLMSAFDDEEEEDDEWGMW